MALAPPPARAYRLLALPSGRLRVLSAWIHAAFSGPQVIELGLIDARYATIQAEANSGHEPEKRTVSRRHEV